MKNIGSRLLSAFALLVALIMAGSMPALARECKETTSQSACERSATCSWVKGYVISKGKQKGKKVSAYCRKKAGKKTSGQSMPSDKNKMARKQSDKKAGTARTTGKKTSAEVDGADGKAGNKASKNSKGSRTGKPAKANDNKKAKKQKAQDKKNTKGKKAGGSKGKSGKNSKTGKKDKKPKKPNKK